MWNPRIFNGDFRLRHRCKSNPRADFNHVGKAAVLCTTESGYTGYCQTVAADAFDLGAHSNEHSAQLLQVGLARSVVNRCNTRGKDGGHDNIGSTRNRRFVEQNEGTFEALSRSLHPIKVVAFFEYELGSKLHEAFEVCV